MSKIMRNLGLDSRGFWL